MLRALDYEVVFEDGLFVVEETCSFKRLEGKLFD
jgi:hypothetical protein